MSETKQRLDGFGPLLKHWRQGRRLSQLALALESGVSQRHLSFLESGRARPSRDMVLQLAEALELPLRERNHLLTNAGFAAAFSYRSLDDTEMAPVRQALDLLLSHHAPYPAVVVDSLWNVVTANAPMYRLLDLLAPGADVWQRIGGGTPNIVKLTLHPQGLRPLIENFEELAAMIVQRCHREASVHPELRTVLDEVLGYPDTPTRWRAPDYGCPTPPLLSMTLRLGTQRMSLFSTITTFGTPQDITTDELRVESMFPADPATATLLRQLDGE